MLQIVIECIFYFSVETIMAEVFTTNGGEIDTIRLNDRGFCHIRFVREDSVDMAMSVAGII